MGECVWGSCHVCMYCSCAQELEQLATCGMGNKVKIWDVSKPSAIKLKLALSHGVHCSLLYVEPFPFLPRLRVTHRPRISLQAQRKLPAAQLRTHMVVIIANNSHRPSRSACIC